MITSNMISLNVGSTLHLYLYILLSVICYYSLDFMVLYQISWASGADSIILHLGLVSWILRGLHSMDYFTRMSQTLV